MAGDGVPGNRIVTPSGEVKARGDTTLIGPSQLTPQG